MVKYGSKDIARASVMMALSEGREAEKELQKQYLAQGIHACGVDFGGDFIQMIPKIIERAVVSAKREGLIRESHEEQGAIIGATREAVSQITPKATGFNVGGKIGIARYGEHISVAVYTGIGILHLNEVAIGLGHRTI